MAHGKTSITMFSTHVQQPQIATLVLAAIVAVDTADMTADCAFDVP